MKRLQILGVALLAVFAVSVVAASMASAVEFLLAEWLVNAEPMTASLAVTIPGTLELVNLNGGGLGVVAKLLCEGILDGTVGPVSADLITEVLNNSGEKIELGVRGLSCTNDGNCAKATVFPEKLPWETELELMVDGTETFFVDLLQNGAYFAECEILGFKITEECKSSSVALKETNEIGGVVDSEFSDAFQTLAGLPLGECGGRANTAEINGLGTIKPDAGSLTVSSGA